MASLWDTLPAEMQEKILQHKHEAEERDRYEAEHTCDTCCESNARFKVWRCANCRHRCCHECVVHELKECAGCGDLECRDCRNFDTGSKCPACKRYLCGSVKFTACQGPLCTECEEQDAGHWCKQSVVAAFRGFRGHGLLICVNCSHYYRAGSGCTYEHCYNYKLEEKDENEENDENAPSTQSTVEVHNQLSQQQA